MKSLFEPDTYSEIKERLNNLSENSDRQWGKMTQGQMAFHCQVPLNVMLEKKDYGLKPNWLIKVFFKKSMYSDKPWKKNLPSPKKFRVMDEKDFVAEKEQLGKLIDELHSNRDKSSWNAHPAFGSFTNEQWGQMQYKHLDHHFRQFGV